jgi:hypothetical protein
MRSKVRGGGGEEKGRGERIYIGGEDRGDREEGERRILISMS